jgi:hypothetical protein
MSHLQKLEAFKHDTVDFEPGPSLLRIKGTITLPDPSKKLQPFLDRVHRAIMADGVKEYQVDVTDLTFVNSSAIRLFVDWVTRLEASGRPYKIAFITDRTKTWQRTAFKGIASLGGESVRILP